MEKHVIIDHDLIRHIFVPRNPRSHKGDHGHSLIMAGSKGKMGAAVIAAKACLRAGTGLLTMLCPQDERAIVHTAIPEAMVIFKEEENDLSTYTAAAAGPGAGLDDSSEFLLKSFIKNFSNRNLVLDADCLSILARHSKWWKNISEHTILTPHPGEFDRLFGKHHSKEERINTAKQIAKEYGWIIVLKDYQSAIITHEEFFLNTTGNQGLAKGGSGDALTGILTAFLSQGYNSLNAAQLAVYFHGMAADMALKSQSYESLLISDVIECLGLAFRSVDTHSYQ